MYIKVRRNNGDHTEELQTLPTRLARLITARERKSLCKTNSLTQTIKRSCEEKGNRLKSVSGIVHNLLKANSPVSKMSRKEHNERRRKAEKGFEHKRLRSAV